MFLIRESISFYFLCSSLYITKESICWVLYWFPCPFLLSISHFVLQVKTYSIYFFAKGCVNYFLQKISCQGTNQTVFISVPFVTTLSSLYFSFQQFGILSWCILVWIMHELKTYHSCPLCVLLYTNPPTPFPFCPPIISSWLQQTLIHNHSNPRKSFHPPYKITQSHPYTSLTQSSLTSDSPSLGANNTNPSEWVNWYSLSSSSS